MSMNIRQIEAFKAIMELGSFTRAAERLGLSQPAVSKLVLLLERKCGFGLFLRQRNGVVPTAEAQMLYEEVERVFLGVDSIQARARAIRKLDHGEIRLVTFPSFATRILPSILAEFLEARPGLRIGPRTPPSTRRPAISTCAPSPPRSCSNSCSRDGCATTSIPAGTPRRPERRQRPLAYGRRDNSLSAEPNPL